MSSHPEVDLGGVAYALAVAHYHPSLEHRLLGIQEQSPLHWTLLLVLVTIELHLHLEVWNKQQATSAQVSIHDTMNGPGSQRKVSLIPFRLNEQEDNNSMQQKGRVKLSNLQHTEAIERNTLGITVIAK